MHTASLAQIKKDLKDVDYDTLMDFCLKLAKYKVETKEYLSFLLYDSEAPQEYLESSKEWIAVEIQEINRSNTYYIKKGLRKIQRKITKWAKFLNNKELEVQLWIYFCQQIQKAGIPYFSQPMLGTIMKQLLKKIDTLIATLHEDLQYDYTQERNELV
jgi:hypothetical protein